MAANARPSTSRSERGVTSRVRSPPAIASAVWAVSRSDSAMRPKAPAMRPTSSCVRAFTVTSRSPSPIFSAASATSRTGRLRRPATNTSAPPTSSSAIRPTRISLVRSAATPARISSFGATATKLQPPVFTGA